MLVARALDRHRLTAAFSLGLALGLAFLAGGFFWLAWLVPGLVLMLGAEQPGKIAFRVGFCAGLGNFLCAGYWLLLIPMKLYALAAWLILPVYLALFYGAWSWACWRCFPAAPCPARGAKRAPAAVQWLPAASWRRRALWALFCGVTWAAMELTVARFGWGFPWNPLGSSQYRLLPLIQIASVTGVGGISCMLVWVSVAFWSGVVVLWQTRARVSSLIPELSVPLVALGGVLLFGYARLATPEPAGGHLRVALVQPAIPQSIIWDPSEGTNRLQKLTALSHAAFAHHPDLLVWPEAALPANVVGRNRDTQDLITSLVRTGGVWMVFGGIDTAPRRDEMGGVHQFNTAFFVDPAGDLIARYFKRHLVVFGEYMPAARWLPFLKRLRETGGGLTAGRGPVAFRMQQPRARISPLICYEDVFPRESRASVDADTDFLLNLTNNGWFGTSAAQWQHAVCALFRAVENGVPLVRCTNNGLTCWIDARGRMHDVYFPGSPDIYQEGFKIVEIPLRSTATQGQRTIYHRWGDWFGWTCVGIVSVSLAWSWRPKWRKPSGAGKSIVCR